MARSKLVLLTLCIWSASCVQVADTFIPVPELPVKLNAQDIWSSASQRSADGSTLMSERQANSSCIQE